MIALRKSKWFSFSFTVYPQSFPHGLNSTPSPPHSNSISNFCFPIFSRPTISFRRSLPVIIFSSAESSLPILAVCTFQLVLCVSLPLLQSTNKFFI